MLYIYNGKLSINQIFVILCEARNKKKSKRKRITLVEVNGREWRGKKLSCLGSHRENSTYVLVLIVFNEESQVEIPGFIDRSFYIKYAGLQLASITYVFSNMSH